MFDVTASNKTTPHSMQLYRIFVKIKMSSMSRLLIIHLFGIHYGNFPKFWLNTSLIWWNQFHYHATIHKQIILSALFIISIPNVFDFRFHSQMRWINGMKKKIPFYRAVTVVIEFLWAFGIVLILMLTSFELRPSCQFNSTIYWKITCHLHIVEMPIIRWLYSAVYNRLTLYTEKIWCSINATVLWNFLESKVLWCSLYNKQSNGKHRYKIVEVIREKIRACHMGYCCKDKS